MTGKLERQRALVADLEAKRKAAWDISGYKNQPVNPMAYVAVGCWNYHYAFNKWRAAADELARMEALAGGGAVMRRRNSLRRAA